MSRFLNRWRSEGGYKELLAIAVPLIISTAAWSIQSFIDRMFLFWYSPEAASSALSGGMMAFTVQSLFIATAAYCNTFVAQYVGAKRALMVGVSIWQGIYFSLIAGILMLCLSPLSRFLFTSFGHEASLQALETTYFQIILSGSIFIFFGDAVSSFFSGRGETVVVMIINTIAVFINCLLNWLWIFGNWGFPEMGIAGAAYATVAAFIFKPIAFFLIMSRRKYRKEYGIFTGYRFDKKIFFRLMKYGIPSGLSMFFDVLIWTFFVQIILHYHVYESAATAVAFQINSLAFMPVIGIVIAVSTLVGQKMGKKSPALAARSAWSALHITVSYMSIMALLYWFTPHIFIRPFGSNADPETFPEIARIIETLLKFVAVYTIFDGTTLIMSGALRGAGDTRFPFLIQLIFSWIFMAIPIGILFYKGYRSLRLTWAFGTLYLIMLSFAMVLRFIKGKWRNMSVIEEPLPPYVVIHPETPAAEVE